MNFNFLFILKYFEYNKFFIYVILLCRSFICTIFIFNFFTLSFIYLYSGSLMLASAQVPFGEKPDAFSNSIVDRNDFDANQGFVKEFPLISIGDPQSGGLEFSIRRAPIGPLHHWDPPKPPTSPSRQSLSQIVKGDRWYFSTDSSISAGALDLEIFPNLQPPGTPGSSATQFIDGWTSGPFNSDEWVAAFMHGGGGTPTTYDIDVARFVVGFETIQMTSRFGDGEVPLPSAQSDLLAEYGPGAVWTRIGAEKVFSPEPDFAYFEMSNQELSTLLGLGVVTKPVTLFLSDGRKIRFDKDGISNGKVSSIEFANGVVHTYHYTALGNTTPAAGGATARLSRLQSVTSSAGYMLHFNYVDDPTQAELSAGMYDERWHIPRKVIGINTSVYNCLPLSFQCSDSTGADWPYVILNGLERFPGASNITQAPYTLWAEGWQVLDSVENRNGDTINFRYQEEPRDCQNIPRISQRCFMVRLAGITSPQDPDIEDFSLTVSPVAGGHEFNAVIDGENWTYFVSETDRSAVVPGATDEVLRGVATGAVTGPNSYSSVWNAAFKGSASGLFDVTDITLNGRTTKCSPGCSSEKGLISVEGQIRLGRSTEHPGGQIETVLYEGGGDIRGLLSERSISPSVQSAYPEIVQSWSYIDTTHSDSAAKYDNWRNYNQATSYVGPRNFVTNYTYDPNHGGLTNRKKPASGAGQYANLRSEARTTYLTLANGAIHPERVTVCRTAQICANAADEIVTTYTYYVPSGLVKTKTVAIGDGSQSRTTRYTYTAKGDIATIDGPLPGPADTIYRYYDDIRRLRAEVMPDPDGSGPLWHPVMRYTYNADGNITQVDAGIASAPEHWNSPLGSYGEFELTSQVSTQYDAYGRKIRDSVMNVGCPPCPPGVLCKVCPGPYGYFPAKVTDYSYDGLGRLQCTAQRMHQTFRDLPSNACVLGPEGDYGADRITRIEYTVHGDVYKVIKAYGTPLQQDYQTYTYYADGMMESVTDANGNRTEYRYDGFNRLERVIFPSKTTPGAINVNDYEAYTYDANGNRTSLRKRDGRVINYQYDNLDRLVVKDIPGSTSLDVYYDYDLRDLQTDSRFGSLSGQGLINSYDGLGQMTSAINTQHGFNLGYQYDVTGSRSRKTFPNGDRIDYTRDTLSRLTGLSLNGTQNLATGIYAQRGHMETLQRAGGAGALSSVTIDQTGRLSSFRHNFSLVENDLIATFEYNPVSQITQRVLNNVAYAHTDKDFAIEGTYTPNGLNQYSQVAGQTLTYDDNGNLTSDGSRTYGYDVENRLTSIGGADTASLTYDPNGRLFETVVNGVTTRFVYDGDALVMELDGSNNVLRRYVHGSRVDSPLVWLEGTGTGDRRYYHADHQGSIIAISNSSGTATDRTSYSPFGVPSSILPGRFAYTGQAVLPGLDLYHYKARVYHPELGRFLQTDPIGYEDQQNMYAYVGNDPMNATDPSGMVIRQLMKKGLKFSAARRAANVARSRARRQAWREEQQLVRETGSGTRRWTDDQKKELLEKGKVKGFEGHHRKTVHDNDVDMARNPDNIEFLTKSEHREKHRAAGGTRASMDEPLLDRTDGGNLERLPGRTGYDGEKFLKPITGGMAGGAVVVLDAMKWGDPTAYALHGLGFSEFCESDGQGSTC